MKNFIEKKFKISKNVFVLGLVSFFNDVGSEMIYPLVPIFLTSVLGAPVVIVGLIEGVSESTASLLKVFSGWLSDKSNKRKPFTIAGYSSSAISKIILSLATVWPFVLVGRFVDRFGKGLRTPARDALLSESSDKSTRGKSFGFHRMLDTLGAVVGPLIALLALKFLDGEFRILFFLAFIPSFIGILLLVTFVKEKKKEKKQTFSFKFKWKDLSQSFKIFLFISFIFALGNSADVFLILRAKNLGFTTSSVILAYILFNIVYALLAIPSGMISDKIGAKKVLISGFLLFSIIYLLFGFTSNSFLIWFLFPIYGIYMALTKGVRKAYISNLVTEEKTGTAFGIYQTTIGLCTFFSSIIAGLLWTYIQPSAPFIFGSVMALLAVILFIVLEKNIRPVEMQKG